PEPKAGVPRVHGSRGMAIKLTGVDGDLLPGDNADRAQDFLMINQPAFAFANVEDYEVLSQVLVDTHKASGHEDGSLFFAQRLAKPTTPPTPLASQAP